MRRGSCTTPTHFGMHLGRTCSQVVPMHFIFSFCPYFAPPARPLRLQPSNLSKPGDVKTKECVRQRNSFSFWRRRLQLSGGRHPRGQLLMYYYQSNVECLCLPGVRYLHPSRPSGGERRWWEVDLIQSDFFSPSTLFFSFWMSAFFCASECCQARRGKEPCDGVGCLWMRFKHREDFQ